MTTPRAIVPFSGSKPLGIGSYPVPHTRNATNPVSSSGTSATTLLAFLASHDHFISGMSAVQKRFWHGTVRAQM